MSLRGRQRDWDGILHYVLPRWTNFRRPCITGSIACGKNKDARNPVAKNEDTLTLTSRRWHDAVRTLGKFHRINPDEVGLGNFGKRSGFYNRQIALFTTLNEVQSKAVDVETKEPVGKIPHFNEMVTFFSDPKLQPQERSTFVHGDYKIDNIVFHKTEPRVIGVLEYVSRFQTMNYANSSNTAGKCPPLDILSQTS